MAGEHPDDRSDFPPPMGKNPDLNASSVVDIEKRLLRVMVSDRVRSGRANPKIRRTMNRIWMLTDSFHTSFWIDAIVCIVFE